MAQCGPTHYRPIAEWVEASSGYVPPNAVEVGYDGDNVLFVARAHHNGDNVPGKLLPAHETCYVPWGGEEHAHRDYEVLTTPFGMNLEWRFNSGGEIPPGAIQGGSAANGEEFFIGRVNQEGKMVCGKVQPSHGCLYVPFSGGEHRHESYEILVVKSVKF